MDKLEELLNKRPKDIEEIALWFDELVKIASDNINKEFSPRRLVKGSRTEEPLPTNTRQLSSFRTRIGTMLEYALSTEIDRIIRKYHTTIQTEKVIQKHYFYSSPKQKINVRITYEQI